MCLGEPSLMDKKVAALFANYSLVRGKIAKRIVGKNS